MKSRPKQKKKASRNLGLEFLESRMCLDAGAGAIAEVWKRTDVNRDNLVTAMDALLVINDLLSAEDNSSATTADSTDTADTGDSGTTPDAGTVAMDDSADDSMDNSTTNSSDDTTDDTGSSSSNDESTCSGHPREPLSSFDADGDGLLTEDELPADLWTKLSSADSDGDGAVSQTELQVAAEARRVQQLFDRFDADEDGSLVESEVPAQLWTKLSPADANSDGALSLEEVTAAADELLLPPGRGGFGPGRHGPGGSPVDRLFAEFDANEDSALTADELPEAIWSHISAADSDGNGSVTQTELAAFRPAPPTRDVLPLRSIHGRRF